MILMHVNTAAFFVIMMWAAWCVLSETVNDGVIGKALFAALAISSYGVVFDDSFFSFRAQVTANVCLALLGVRHFVVHRYWPAFQNKIMRRIRCADCPHHQPKD